MSEKAFRKIILLPCLIAMLIVVACMGASVYAAESAAASEVYVLDEGTCSSGVKWVHTSDGILKFTGNGAIISEQVNLGSTQWSSNGKVKTIVIGEGVTAIPEYAFEYCVNLTSVQMPSTLTNIGQYAFRGCRSLVSVVIPEGVRTVSSYAFSECTALESVQLPSTATNLGVYIFNKSGLKSIVIPDTVTTIPAGCFIDCASLSSVTFGSSVKNINDSAFKNCDALASIELPASLKSLGQSAFQDCDGLTDVALPSSISNFGASVFAYCDNLKSINIPTSLRVISEKAFYYCTALESVEISGRVNSIVEYAFAYCGSLREITLPGGLVGIGPYAFQNCCSLTSINLPYSLDTINSAAFYGCYKLVEVYDLSEDITVVKNGTGNGYVGYYASVIHTSADEESIITVTDDGLVVIPYNDKYAVIDYVGDATELYLPDYYNGSEYLIYNYAFYGDTKLTSIRIGEGVTTIGFSAFKGCDNVEKYIFDAISCYINKDDSYGVPMGGSEKGVDVIIGAKVTAIPQNFLYNKGYTNVKSVTFAEGGVCASIGANAFYGCSAITEIALPDTVTEIGNYAFYECSALESVIFPEAMELVGEYAFSKCAALTGIGLKSAVVSIGQYAFSYCSSAVSLTIPEATQNIGYFAFAYCAALEDVRFNATYAYGVSNNQPFYQSGGDGNGIIFTVGSNVEYIPDQLFYSNDYASDENRPVLKKVIFEEGSRCLEIGESAFYKAIHLTEAVLPESLTAIGGAAFSGCIALERINVPKNVTSIGVMAFYDCKSVTEFYYNAARVTGITSSSNLISNLGRSASGVRLIIGRDAEVIPDSMFRRYATNTTPNIVSLEFEEGTVCTTIGAYAFSDLTYLRAAEIGEAVTSVGNYAFYNCTALREMKFNAVNCGSMISSGSYTFINVGSSNGFKLIIGASVTRIPDYFMDTYTSYAYVTEVIFEEGSVCEYIGYCAFDGCQKLTTVTLPDTVVTISGYAFRSTPIRSINIPRSVTSVGNGAFYNCTALNAIRFNAVSMKGLSSGNNVFYKCGTSGDGINVLIGKDVTVIPAYLFYSGSSSNQPKVTDIIFEAGSLCKSIGNYAFYYLDDMESFDIPASVTSIGSYAFSGCSKLTSIRIRSAVTQVGSNAFSACSRLRLVFIDSATVAGAIGSSSANAGALVQNAATIVFPSTLNFVSSYINANFKNVDRFMLDGEAVAVYSKHEHGFENGNWNHLSVSLAKCNICEVNRNVERVAEGTCGKTLTWVINELGALYVMGEGDMYGYSASGIPWAAYKDRITSVIVGDGVTSVGKCAFYGLTALRGVSLSDSVTYIGQYAFFGCTSLESFFIPAKVETVDAYAFRKSGLKYLSVEATVGWSAGGESVAVSDACDVLKLAKLISVDAYAKEWKRDTEVALGDDAIVARGTCGENAYWIFTEAGELIVSGSGETSSYSSGGAPWYELRTDIVRITVCEGITSLGSYIFQRTSAVSVSLPTTLTRVRSYAFSTTKLEEFTVPASVTYFESGAFYACGTITKVYITDMRAWFGIKFADEYANPVGEGVEIYYDGKLLTEVTVPSGITEISNAVFAGYQYLEKVVLHGGVVSIGSSAFEGCTALAAVVLPESLTSVGNSAFSGCTSLKEITIPSSAKTIGNYAFSGCTALTKATFNNGATVIGNSMFSGCTALETVTVPVTVTSIGSKAFEGCTALTSVSIPEGITAIETYTFYNCSALTEIAIPSTVTVIDANAFEGCFSLASVTLPDGLTTIGASAFRGCSALAAVNLPESLGSIGNYAFYECKGLTRVRVDALKCYVSGSSNYAFGYAGNDGSGIEVIIGSEVSEIPAYLFCPFYSTSSSSATTAYAPNIVSVVFEAGSKCTSVGSYAFIYCDDFDTLFLPESVTNVGGMAFNGCNDLYYVYIANPALAVNATSASSIGYLAGVPTVAFRNSEAGVGSYISAKAYSDAIRYGGEDYTVYSDHCHDATDGRWTVDPDAECVGYICDVCGIIKNEMETVGGSCSSRVKWTLTDEGTLVISGEGAMPAYSSSTMPWYAYKDKITAVVIGDGITSIGRTSFYGFTALTRVVMADTVTSIGSYAFFGCTGLTEINIPESVNYIDVYAFRKCSALTQVRFFNVGGWSAGDKAFEDIVLFDFEFAADCMVDTYFGSVWTRDTSVTHDYYKLRDYGKVNDTVFWRFAKNGALTIYGSGTITSTPWSVYKDEIYALTITDGIVGGTGSYTRYEHLRTVVIGNGITSIPSSAFAYCTSLSDVTIGEGVTSIGKYAFDGCGVLRNLYFNAISCDNFYGSNYVFRKAGEWSSLTLYVGPKVTKIPSYMFRPGGDYDKAYVSYVKFAENSVCTTIGAYAFYGCASLYELEIPASVTTIGEYAVAKLSYLKKLNYNAVNASLYNMHVFSGMGKKGAGVELTIGPDVERIPSYIFYCGYSGDYDSFVLLKKVIFSEGSSCVAIGNYAFGHISEGLSEVHVASVEDWVKIVFENKMSNPLIPNGLEKTRLYVGGKLVTDIVIPEGTERINDYAFYGVEISSLSVPKSVKYIGVEAFYLSNIVELYFNAENCEDFTETNSTYGVIGLNTSGVTITIGKDVKRIPAYFAYHSGSSSASATLIFEEGSACTEIGEYAFCYRTNLNYVTLPEGITTVGDYAFGYCYILRLTLPETLTTIGKYAFNYGSYYNLVIPESVTSVDSYGFRSQEYTVYINSGEVVKNTVSGSAYANIFGTAKSIAVAKEVADQVGSYITDRFGKYVTEISYNGVAYVLYSAHTHAENATTWEDISSETQIAYRCKTCLVVKNNLIVAKGTCGTALEWKLFANGVLMINGEGEMANYSASTLPWKDHVSLITSVEIAEGVTSIGNTAFYGLTALTEVKLPSTLTRISRYAFFGCTSLDYVLIPGSVTYIGQYAFRKSGITAVRFENVNGWSVNGAGIGYMRLIDTAYAATSLRDTSYSYEWARNPKAESVVSAYGEIGKTAFWLLTDDGELIISGSGNIPQSFMPADLRSGVVKVVIGDGITSIGARAFYGFPMKSVTVGAGVKTIGDEAFYNCTLIAELIFNAVECENLSGNNTFYCAGKSGSGIAVTFGAAVKRVPDNLFNTFMSSDVPYITSVKFLSGSVCEYIGSYVFYNSYYLSGISIPATVKSIGNYAFWGCATIKEILIPQGVTTVGNSAFAGCTSLVSVNLKATSIGNYCFAGCTSLTTVKLPYGMLTIGEYAFNGCAKLSSINLPNTITAIGKYAFCGCESLTSVTIPSLVTKIEAGTFDTCRGLTSVTIGKGVKTIGAQAFRYCISLTTITVPEGVTTLENYAFSDCTYTTKFNLPKSLTYIGNDAFNNCLSLRSIEIPAGVTYIGMALFSDCDILRTITVAEGNKVYHSAGNCIIHTESKTLVAGCRDSVIPNDGSVRIIGAQAFAQVYELREVKIPYGITEIEEYAFYNCVWLGEVVISDTVKTIGKGAFASCGMLFKLTLGRGVTSIGEAAFRECDMLSEVVIPDTLVHIGAEAFRGCDYLNIITIGSRVTSIGANAFANCTNLYRVVFKGTDGWTAGSTAVSASDLANTSTAATRLKTTYVSSEWHRNIVLPGMVDGGSCGKDAMWSLDADGVLTIYGEGCMYDYNYNTMPWYKYRASITKLVVDVGILSIGRCAFYGHTALETAELPVTMMSIGEYAFFSASKLSSVNIPERVLSIGVYAFRKTALASASFAESDGWYIDGKSAASATLSDASAAASSLKENFTLIWTRPTDGEGDIIAAGRVTSAIKWKLSENGILTVYGSGAIPNYASNNMPWYDYRYVILKVVVDEGITRVGKCAFYGCTTVSTLSIASTVTQIGQYAFYNCANMTYVNIPESVTQIEVFAFRKCTRLYVDFAIKYGWSAGSNVFAAAELLPEGAGQYLSTGFYNVVWTRDVNAPFEEADPNFVTGGMCGSKAKWQLFWLDESKTAMKLVLSGSGATTEFGTGGAPWYEYADKITEIEVSGISAIGRCAFYNLTKVTKVTLGEGVATIGDYAFNTCTALKEITIPASVTRIGVQAFAKSGVTAVTFLSASGWSAGDVAIAESDLADTVAAATYIKSTYRASAWTKA